MVFPSLFAPPIIIEYDRYSLLRDMEYSPQVFKGSLGPVLLKPDEALVSSTLSQCLPLIHTLSIASSNRFVNRVMSLFL